MLCLFKNKREVACHVCNDLRSLTDTGIVVIDCKKTDPFKIYATAFRCGVNAEAIVCKWCCLANHIVPKVFKTTRTELDILHCRNRVLKDLINADQICCVAHIYDTDLQRNSSTCNIGNA